MVSMSLSAFPSTIISIADRKSFNAEVKIISPIQMISQIHSNFRLAFILIALYVYWKSIIGACEYYEISNLAVFFCVE